MFSTWFNYVINNVGDDIPDPKKDIDRIITLHSQHDRLGRFTKGYPLLIQQTDDNSNGFHWTIILDDDLNDYCIKIDDSNQYHKISDELKGFIKSFPIYLDSDFGNDTDKNKFMILQYEMMCKAFWEEFLDIYRQAVIDELRKRGHILTL